MLSSLGQGNIASLILSVSYIKNLLICIPIIIFQSYSFASYLFNCCSKDFPFSLYVQWNPIVFQQQSFQLFRRLPILIISPTKPNCLPTVWCPVFFISFCPVSFWESTPLLHYLYRDEFTVTCLYMVTEDQVVNCVLFSCSLHMLFSFIMCPRFRSNKNNCNIMPHTLYSSLQFCEGAPRLSDEIWAGCSSSDAQSANYSCAGCASCHSDGVGSSHHHRQKHYTHDSTGCCLYPFLPPENIRETTL